MGCCSKIIKSSSVLVVLVAVSIGCLFAGIPGQLGLWKYMDAAISEDGATMNMGDFPAMHDGTPWGFDFDSIPDGHLAGKTILVTGANVGLGYWSAHYLAKKGGHVVMACRSDTKCTKAADAIRADLSQGPMVGTLETATLDLSSLQSVKTFAAVFIAGHKQLHSLMLNAGLGMAPHSLTVDGLETVMGVNHFGHFYLTQLLLPLLEATGTTSLPATIVSVASGAHHFCNAACATALDSLATINAGVGFPQYGMSKGANILFTIELARRLALRSDTNVLVNAAHPGGVSTDFNRNIIDKIYASLPQAAAQVAENFMNSAFSSFAWQPKEAALTQCAAAVSPALLASRITGKYYHPIFRLAIPSALFRDPARAEKLWELSEQVIMERVAKLK